MLNLLRGKADQWATALWKGKPWVLDSCESFASEIRRVFDHPVQGQEALSVYELYVKGLLQWHLDFCVLAVESGWNDKALRGVCVKGLGKELKDELAACDEPENLEGLIALAIRIDHRNRERSSQPRAISVTSPSSHSMLCQPSPAPSQN